MFKKAVFDPAALITTNLPANSTLVGELRCDGNLHIGGDVSGQIHCSGTVIISEDAIVRANITARSVSVAGSVEGDLDADRVEILAGARVIGDVTVVDLLLDEGGLVRGRVVMRKDELGALEPLPLHDELSVEAPLPEDEQGDQESPLA